MQCPTCHQDTPAAEKLCRHCQSPLARYYPPEGFVLDPQTGFYCRTTTAEDATCITRFDAFYGTYSQETIRHPAAVPVHNAPYSSPQAPGFYSPPPGFVLDIPSGLYYQMCSAVNEQGKSGKAVTWFNCQTGQMTPRFYPNENRSVIQRLFSGKKQMVLAILVVLLLLLGMTIWNFSRFDYVPAGSSRSVSELPTTPRFEEAEAEAAEEIPVSGAIEWRDPVVEQVVRDYLDRPHGAIVEDDLRSIRSLKFTYEGHSFDTSDYTYNYTPHDGFVKDVSDFAHFPNLARLQLSDQQIADYSPLADIPGLQSLNLDSSEITDVGQLRGLTNLTELSLSFNGLLDASGLAGLTQLTSLDLAYNQLTDIDFLSGMTELRSLYIYGNEITDIGPLAGLTLLEHLDLSSNAIEEVDALADMRLLEYLELNRNRISDVSALANLENLSTLYLANNELVDISPLAGLTGLRSLSMYNNQITDVSPLADLTSLYHLDLSGNPIEDWEPLAGIEYVSGRDDDGYGREWYESSDGTSTLSFITYYFEYALDELQYFEILEDTPGYSEDGLDYYSLTYLDNSYFAYRGEELVEVRILLEEVFYVPSFTYEELVQDRDGDVITDSVYSNERGVYLTNAYYEEDGYTFYFEEQEDGTYTHVLVYPTES